MTALRGLVWGLRVGVVAYHGSTALGLWTDRGPLESPDWVRQHLPPPGYHAVMPVVLIGYATALVLSWLGATRWPKAAFRAEVVLLALPGLAKIVAFLAIDVFGALPRDLPRYPGPLGLVLWGLVVPEKGAGLLWFLLQPALIAARIAEPRSHRAGCPPRAHERGDTLFP